MRRALPLTALLAVLAAAVALAACGGSDETTPASTASADESTTATDADVSAGGAEEDGEEVGPTDEQQITAAIEALLIDPDNEFVCNEVLTEKLLSTAYGDLQGCLDGRGGPTLAESAKVKGLMVDAASATATAVPKGGLYDGEDLEVEAVDVDGDWRINRFVADIPVGP